MAAPKVFVSYRRKDSAATSGRLRGHMAVRLGDKRVFLDVDKIGLGEDFVTAIETEISRCQVMLVMIGRDWGDPNGQGARLHHPMDHVRAEIRAGLSTGLRVIPVLVDGATMPDPDDLPEHLKLLARLNAFEIRNARFADDADALIGLIVGEKPRRDGRAGIGTLALWFLGGGLAGLVLYVLIGIIHNAATGRALDAVLGAGTTTLMFPLFFLLGGGLAAFKRSKRCHRETAMKPLQRFGEYLRQTITTAPRVPQARKGFGDSTFS